MSKGYWAVVIVAGIVILTIGTYVGGIVMAPPDKDEAAYYVVGCGDKWAVYFNEFLKHDNGVTATVEAYYQPAFVRYEFIEDEPIEVDIGQIRSNKKRP